jgi:hypothetical protein
MAKTKFDNPDIFIPPQSSDAGPVQAAQPVQISTERDLPPAPNGFEYIQESEWTPTERTYVNTTGQWPMRAIPVTKDKAQVNLALQGLRNAMGVVDTMSGTHMALNSTGVKRELTYVLQYAIAALTGDVEPEF